MNIKVENSVERVYCLLYVTLSICFRRLSCFLEEEFISGALYLHKDFLRLGHYERSVKP